MLEASKKQVAQIDRSSEKMRRGNEQKKRILFLIDSMYGGGAERQTVELIQALHPRYEIALSLLNEQGPLLDEVPRDVSVLNLEGCAGWRRAVQGSLRLRSVIEAYQPDVIISSLIESNRLLARTAPFLPGDSKTVLTVQNNLSLNMERRSFLARLFDRIEVPLLYNRADCIVAVSEGVRESLMNVYGIPSSRLQVIHNMVNIGRVQERAHRPASLPWENEDTVPLLVAVGRMVPQKAFHDLLDAFAVVRRGQVARLVILGDGPLRSELKSKTDRLGVTDDVHMPGYVDNPWAYMRRSDVFVSSSHWEGFSLAHLEAMVCGCPLVLTDCDFGPKELVRDGFNGRLAPVGCPGALAGVISELLNDPEQRKQIAQNAKAYVQRYDRSSIAARYGRLIQDLLDAPNRAAVQFGTGRA